MKILITGATGFLGRRLAVRLFGAWEGCKLYGLARNSASAHQLERIQVRPVVADLNDAAQLTEALGELEFDAVFHLAAEIASQRSKKLLRETNIDGTANLYEALKSQHRLQAFIFTSTVVTGDAEGALLTEETPLPVETEYGRTKQAGEELLLEAFHSHHFPVRIVRPCHIYGDGGWFGEVTQQLRRGKLRMPGDGKNLWDVVHVDDVAAAPASVLKHGQNGEIYHVADDTPVAMGEFVAEAARVLGVDPPGSAPIFLANLFYGKDTILSVTRSARTSNKKLKALGWKPAYPDYRTGLHAALCSAE